MEYSARLATMICTAALIACSEKPSRIIANGDVERGKQAMVNYGCNSCHTIPGVSGANALAAPPLIGISKRSYLAGMLENTPENLMRWIQHPRQVNPHTAMPEQNVTDQDARDMAAYLYSTR